MKKIFTLLGGMALAGTFAVSAETVSLQICTSKGVDVAKSCETELTRNEVGNYVIADFLNSGSPLAFTFDSSVEVGKTAAIELRGNFEDETPYLYLLNSDDDYPICSFTLLEGDEAVSLYYPYIYYGSKYTYVSHLDKAESGYDYSARICISGFGADDDYADWYYIYMYFDEIPYDGPGEEEEPGATLLQSLDVTCDVEGWYYADDDADAVDVTAQSFDTKLEIYDDGTYTLKNVFGTDTSISYTIGNFSPKRQALMTYTDNIYKYNGYPYFLTPDGDYLDATLEDENGGKIEAESLYGCEGIDSTGYIYSYVYKSSAAEIAEGYDEYYGYMYIAGYVGDEGSTGMWVSYGYNLTTTGVSGVNTENAPVEYFNLNGRRVSDPSNGIFIRRQGAKTSKVLIK